MLAGQSLLLLLSCVYTGHHVIAVPLGLGNVTVTGATVTDVNNKEQDDSTYGPTSEESHKMTSEENAQISTPVTSSFTQSKETNGSALSKDDTSQNIHPKNAETTHSSLSSKKSSEKTLSYFKPHKAKESCDRYGRFLSTLDLCWETVASSRGDMLRLGTYVPIIRVSQYENASEIHQELEMYCSLYDQFLKCAEDKLISCDTDKLLLGRLKLTGRRACDGQSVKTDLRDAISTHFDASLSDRLTCIDEVADVRYGECVRHETDLLRGAALNMMDTTAALALLQRSYQRSLACLFHLLWDKQQTECQSRDVDFLLETALLSLPAGLYITRQDLLHEHTDYLDQ